LRTLLLPLVVLTLVAAACGGSSDDVASEEGAQLVDDDSSADTDENAPATTAAPVAGPKPEVEIPAGDAPSELVIDDLIDGDGDQAQTGDTVEVHYVGVLFDTGEEFDASWNRGQTFSFALGQGQVIQGWDQGFEGMKVGGRRRLTIPSDLAYGPNGSGPTIGPDATLVFVVDLVSVTPPLAPVDPADEPEIAWPDELTDELVIEDITVGEGPELGPDDTAVVHFVVGVAEEETVVQSSWATGIGISVNMADTVVGLKEGMIGMQAGGRRMVVVPPEPESPGDTQHLVFIIDLFEIS
jgi:peptidylprolyl isomerase